MKEASQVDGPQPSKESMDLMDDASQLLYRAYGKLKLARMAVGTTTELLQMKDQSKVQQARDNMESAQSLLKEGQALQRQGQDKVNAALAKSPDVDPNSKVWSATMQ